MMNKAIAQLQKWDEEQFARKVGPVATILHAPNQRQNLHWPSSRGSFSRIAYSLRVKFPPHTKHKACVPLKALC